MTMRIVGEHERLPGPTICDLATGDHQTAVLGQFVQLAESLHQQLSGAGWRGCRQLARQVTSLLA